MIDTVFLGAMLARSRFFSSLSEHERLALTKKMRDIVLEPGETLFLRGDPGREMYLVLQGRIRLSVTSSDGRALSFAHAVAGDVFGEVAVLDGAARSADATAISRVRLKALARPIVHQVLKSNSAAALSTIELLCGRLRELSEHVEAIALHPIDVRMARLILDLLSDREKQPADRTRPIALGMSQSDLASLIGSTRQRANAALNSLEKAGAIRRSGDLLDCDVHQLRKLADRAL